MTSASRHTGAAHTGSCQFLIDVIRRAWSSETSASPEQWSPKVPSTGQCAVTALVLQDHLGGTLLRGTVDGISHYWLRTPTGEDLDLTIDQFEGHVSTEPSPRTREYVLSFDSTSKRYHKLAADVAKRM